MNIDEAIQEYQCSGCVNGPYPECFVPDDINPQNKACQNHCPGTIIFNGLLTYTVLLGMPKGFNRFSGSKEMRVSIFDTFDDGWGYDFLSVPIWKHLDIHGNTIVKGVCPRIMMAWVHVFLEDDVDKVDCFLITKKEQKGMD